MVASHLHTVFTCRTCTSGALVSSPSLSPSGFLHQQCTTLASLCCVISSLTECEAALPSLSLWADPDPRAHGEAAPPASSCFLGNKTPSGGSQLKQRLSLVSCACSQIKATSLCARSTVRQWTCSAMSRPWRLSQRAPFRLLLRPSRLLLRPSRPLPPSLCHTRPFHGWWPQSFSFHAQLYRPSS